MTQCQQFDRRQGHPRANHCGSSSSARSAKTVAALAILVATAAPSAAGTTGGRMGNVSRATIGISVSVAPRLELLRAGAMTVGRVPGEASIRETHPLCIWGNTALGTYKVTVRGNAQRGFSVADRAGHALPYSVEWTSTGRGQRPLFSGEALEGPVASKVGCGGGVTAGLVVKLPDVIERAPEVVFGGNLLLIVAPD
jgi:hypothetical protein